MHSRGSPPSRLAVTWWGHSSISIEIGGVRVATDPLLTSRLFHLRRVSPPPPPGAADADVVLVSHLHRDHLHLPSLRRFDPDVPIVVPAGASRAVTALRRRRLLEVAPGDTLEVAGLRLQVLAADHDGRRSSFERAVAPALGFRFGDGTTSCWYPGDTGVRTDVSDLDPVDLAAVPIGGWGPSLGQEHLDPEQAAAAVAAIGARWALAVHYGTLWPVAMRRLHPDTYQRLFVSPPARFSEALEASGTGAVPLTPRHGERLDLDPPGRQRGWVATPEEPRRGAPQRARWTLPSAQTGSSDS